MRPVIRDFKPKMPSLHILHRILNRRDYRKQIRIERIFYKLSAVLKKGSLFIVSLCFSRLASNKRTIEVRDENMMDSADIRNVRKGQLVEEGRTHLNQHRMWKQEEGIRHS